MMVDGSYLEVMLPTDWEVKKISEIGKVKGGKRLPKGYELQSLDNGYPYITVGDMKNGSVNLATIRYAPTEVIVKIKNYTISCKDIYITVVGSTLGSIGIVPEELDGALLTENADKITDLKVNQKYLMYVLDSPNFQTIISNERTINAQPKLAIGKINDFKIPVPPLNEQQKIATILSIWDKAIELKEQLIEEKKQQKKGLMKMLLTGQVRLPEFDGEWKEVRLGTILKERSEIRCNLLELLAITGKNGIVKRTEVNIKDNSNEDKSKYKRICPLDIGYNTMRMWQGVSGVSEYEGIVSPAYTILAPTKNIDSYFMGYLFKFPKMINIFWRHSQGMVNDTLNLKYSNLKNIKVRIPKEKTEQSEIAKVFMTIDKSIELIEMELSALKLQKKGLMQLLLTGIVRVQC